MKPEVILNEVKDLAFPEHSNAVILNEVKDLAFPEHSEGIQGRDSSLRSE